MSSSTDAIWPRTAGICRRRRVCPVGAVSTTTTSTGAARARRESSRSPISSSVPGRERDRNRSTSSRSRYVPRRTMVASRSRLCWSQRARAASASSSTARKLPRRTGTGRGRGPSRMPKASPREWAGSVETASTRCPDSASATAMAAEHVVLPTPPLPPKKRKTVAEVRRRRSAMAAGLGARGFVLARAFLVLFAREGGLDPCDLHLARGRGGGAVALADLADAGQEVLLRLRELLFAVLTELPPHLRGQQLLAQDGVV